jgi:hypothetical protein
MVEDFRVDYNPSRPHRAHAMLTPAAFAESFRDPSLTPAATTAGKGSSCVSC